MNEAFEALTNNLSDAKVVAADVLSDIAVELDNYRVVNNLDQKDLARILNVSQPMISKYESGSYNFTIKTLYEIAFKLGLDVDFAIRSTASNESNDNGVFIAREKKNPYSNFFANSTATMTNESSNGGHN